MEARYQDVLELLQSEGGRIASLQVGCMMICLTLCAALSGCAGAAAVRGGRIAGLQLGAALQSTRRACKSLQTFLAQDASAPHPPPSHPFPAGGGQLCNQIATPLLLLCYHLTPSVWLCCHLPHLLQEAVSSAASEKGLQTFQAQDALAQQLSMQLQLQQAEAERQVRVCGPAVFTVWLARRAAGRASWRVVAWPLDSMLLKRAGLRHVPGSFGMQGAPAKPVLLRLTTCAGGHCSGDGAQKRGDCG